MSKPAQSKISVNLLTQDEFSSSPIGKVLLWALSVGRYIVVFTELIVILSFLSRFKLDRDLTDINESIEKQKAIIESYGGLEEEFRAQQKLLKFVAQKSPEPSVSDSLIIIKETMPTDIKLETFSYQADELNLKATALSLPAFSSFINTLLRNQDIADISIKSIEAQAQGLIVTFELVATLNQS